MSDGQLVHRVAVASAVVVAVLAGCALLLRYPEVPLLAFAGVLGALLLDGIAGPLARLTRLPRGVLVVALALASVGATALCAWLYGPRLADQTGQLLATLQDHVQDLWHGMPDPLESAIPASPAAVDWQRLAPLAFGSVAGLFSTALGAASGLLIAFALAVFLALQPELYLRGALRMIPARRRERIAEVLRAVAHALRWWLVGRAFAMAAVATLTVLGLFWIGIPQAPALGVIAGVLTFIPYVGPIAAAVPAVAVALTQSLPTAAWVVALYGAVQMVENYLVTPLAQSRAVSLPPALLIAAGVLLAVLFGIFGVLLATPLTVAGIVLIQALYVQDVLGEDVRLLGEDEGRAGSVVTFLRRRGARGTKSAG